MSKIVYAVSILSGTIIGAGLFALPYLTLQVSIWVMLGYFIVLGFLAFLIHYFFAEVALETPDFIRIPKFAQKYLGNTGYRIALFSGILGLFGVNLAYLILGGEFLNAIFNPFIGFNPVFYTLIYFLVGSLVVFWGIKAISKIQFFGLALFLITTILIFYQGWDHFNFLSIFNYEINFSYLFLPYGAVLFSFWGVHLIPEIEEMLEGKKYLLKKIIPISIIIPAIFYLIFVFLILGITGNQTTESALTGLQGFLGNGLTIFILFLGIITTFTSFITLSLTLKKIFWYDLKLNKNISWIITCFVPLFLFLLGIKDFIRVIAFIGGVMLAIDGILIMFIHQKVFPFKFRKLKYFLIFALFLGIIYELIYFFR